MGKESESTFLQRRYTHGQQTREKMLSITDYQGNANQSHNETQLTPTRMAIVKEMDDKECWWEWGEMATLCVAGGDGKWDSRCGKQLAVLWPNFASKCLPKRNENICPHRNFYMNVYSNIIHRSQKVETTQVSIHRWWIHKLCSFHTWNIIRPWKGVKHWHSLQHGWTLRTRCSEREARHRRTHSVWFHWRETFRTGRATDTESGFLVVRGWERENREWLLIWCSSGVMRIFWN